MLDNTKNYKVSFFGEDYYLLSDDPEELVESSVKLLDNLMRELADAVKTPDVKNIAVLAALQLANKLLKHEQSHKQYSKQSSHIRKLIEYKLAQLNNYQEHQNISV